MPYTILAASAPSLWRALESYGVAPGAMLRRAGLDPGKLHDPNARYCDADLFKLWQLALEATKDP